MDAEPDASNPGADAIEELYATLRAIAQAQMRSERNGHTLQATAVVNEAYMRISNLDDAVYRDREHFLSIAAATIRRVLIDHARAHNASKRGGDAARITLHTGLSAPANNTDSQVDILELDEALRRLADRDPDAARLVELRFFAGLPIERAADALGIARATANRQWRVARAWLMRELTDATDAKATGPAE